MKVKVSRHGVIVQREYFRYRKIVVVPMREIEVEGEDLGSVFDTEENELQQKW